MIVWGVVCGCGVLCTGAVCGVRCAECGVRCAVCGVVAGCTSIMSSLSG